MGPVREDSSAYGVPWFPWIQFKLIPWPVVSLPWSWIHQRFNLGTKFISNTRNYTWGQTCLALCLIDSTLTCKTGMMFSYPHGVGGGSNETTLQTTSHILASDLGKVVIVHIVCRQSNFLEKQHKMCHSTKGKWLIASNQEGKKTEHKVWYDEKLSQFI